MRIQDKVVLVTGGASGIGRALAERFHAEGAAGVAVADLDGGRAAHVADAIDGLAIEADVSREEDVRGAVRRTEERFGPIDLLCSNAGILFTDAPGWTAASQTDAQWEKIWKVNVMAHVWGARAVLPGMIRRGGGYLLHTASAAGLLSQIGDASYSTTKHAAIGFAESVAITHGEQGIKVSVLCPQAVDTAMLHGAARAETAAVDPVGKDGAAGAASVDGVLTAEDVAAAAVEGLRDERFLILPHPRVSEYFRRKASDYDRWLAGMRRFRRSLFPDDEIMRFDDGGMA
jgi:NAD(P)-dependent dehydrogenase (short-subunit alcohol dehydrogenase family)